MGNITTINTAPPAQLAASFTPPPLPPGVTASGPSSSSTSTILRHVALYGSVGAAVGFGASFLSIPVIGQLAAPIVAAIGGAIGATIGFFVGRSKASRNGAAADTVPPQLPAWQGHAVLGNQLMPTSDGDGSAKPVGPAKLAEQHTGLASPIARDTLRDEILARFDKNHDNSIVLATEVESATLRANFVGLADMNHDGTVTREELNDTLANADTDKDGNLSRAELTAFLKAGKADAPAAAATPTDKPPVAQTGSAPTGRPPVPASFSTDDDASQSPVPTQAGAVKH